MRFHFVDVLLNMKYGGPSAVPCDATYRKGDELGGFEHGSIIVVLAPAGFTLCPGVEKCTQIRMERPLLRVA